MNKKIINTKRKIKFHTTLQLKQKKAKRHYVVINTCYGGFGLSKAARDMLNELGFVADSEYDYNRIARHDPRLIKVVRKLGQEAEGDYAALHIARIKGNKYIIEEYDGVEGVQEPDDIEWIIIED